MSRPGALAEAVDSPPARSAFRLAMRRATPPDGLNLGPGQLPAELRVDGAWVHR